MSERNDNDESIQSKTVTMESEHKSPGLNKRYVVCDILAKLPIICKGVLLLF
jgi:hypothetical protein